jgi:hypothetical protein
MKLVLVAMSQNRLSQILSRVQYTGTCRVPLTQNQRKDIHQPSSRVLVLVTQRGSTCNDTYIIEGGLRMEDISVAADLAACGFTGSIIYHSPFIGDDVGLSWTSRVSPIQNNNALRRSQICEYPQCLLRISAGLSLPLMK